MVSTCQTSVFLFCAGATPVTVPLSRMHRYDPPEYSTKSRYSYAAAGSYSPRGFGATFPKSVSIYLFSDSISVLLVTSTAAGSLTGYPSV